MQKKIYKIVFVLIIFFLIYSILKPIPERRAKIAYQKNKTEILEEKLKAEKEKNIKLKEEIENTKKQSNIEKISRNNLKMSKEGEKLYKFVDEEDNNDKENNEANVIENNKEKENK